MAGECCCQVGRLDRCHAVNCALTWLGCFRGSPDSRSFTAANFVEMCMLAEIRSNGPVALSLTCTGPCCAVLQVQEYCDLGTLGGIASSWDPCDECDEQMLERLTLLTDTARGLEALHADHVVHGDVVSCMLV